MRGIQKNVMRTVYAIVGAILGGVTDLLVNLLAASLQQRAFQDQFSNHSIGWLIGLIIIGLLLGVYLSKMMEFDVAEKIMQSSRPAVKKSSTKRIKMTRLRAILSYNVLRGQGIELGDILSIGSVVIIDSRD